MQYDYISFILLLLKRMAMCLSLFNFHCTSCKIFYPIQKPLISLETSIYYLDGLLYRLPSRSSWNFPLLCYPGHSLGHFWAISPVTKIYYLSLVFFFSLFQWNTFSNKNNNSSSSSFRLKQVWQPSARCWPPLTNLPQGSSLSRIALWSWRISLILRPPLSFGESPSPCS